jgi:predicted transposase YdaD
LTTEYNLPVDSFVIHLLDDTELPRSPLHWTIHDKKKVIDFYYETIELSRLTWEDLFSIGLIGLYPLISLTKDGTQRAVVERMFGELGETGKTDLELIAFTLASYKFAKLDVDEQDWLIRSFYKMHDFLVESPIYQLILQEGRQEGRDEALQQGQMLGQRRALEDAIIAITLERFPKLIDLATRKAEHIQHPTILQQVLLKISLVPTIEEAREYLLRIDDE